MKRLVILLPAEQEMTEAAQFYASRAEHLGAIFLSEVEVALRRICSRPALCPMIRSGIRRKMLLRFPYAILYREDPDEIVVLAIMHLHRRPGYWKDRT